MRHRCQELRIKLKTRVGRAEDTVAIRCRKRQLEWGPFARSTIPVAGALASFLQLVVTVVVDGKPEKFLRAFSGFAERGAMDQLLTGFP